jgi:TonB-linked SusC/RagA family outer membrane protein
VTDIDGNFTLNVSDDAVLRISFIGYIEQNVNTAGKNTLQVVLQEDTKTLEEVVVVGYGTQKKVNLTGSVSTIQFDEELENRPITNASQALSGKTTGVWVSQNSGKPGSDEAQLRVRGWGTLNNSNPLVIIDGVEGNFNQINPSDIENISVLKDAASAAIYGSKAANGVILVTTKTGRKDEKMQVSLSSYVGVQSLGRRYDVITNSAEQMRLTNQAFINEGSSAYYPDYLITAFENGTDPYKYPNTDWFEVLFKDAFIQEHNVSITGGSSQISSFLSFNYLSQKGMVPNTNAERFGIRANIDSNVNKWLKVGARLNYTRKSTQEPYADVIYGSLGRVFDMLSGATPYIAPYTRDGKFGAVQAIDNEGIPLYDNRNPLIEAANGATKGQIDFLTVNASVEINFFKDLLWKTTLATSGNWAVTDRFNETIYGYRDDGEEMMNKNYNREGLEISRNENTVIGNTLFSTLNYNHQFAEKHDLGIIAGLQLENENMKNVYARRANPPKEGLTQVDAGTDGFQAEGNMQRLRMFSYFGRANYAFQNKYLFEANLRADASSRFKKGNRWGIFPGFSAGWRLGEENFIKNLDLFSNLKLRVSWGELGNQNIGWYWPYLAAINQSNNLSYSYGGTFSPGAAVTSLVDENITWETTSTFDIGFDLGFVNNKINMEADYFRKKTSDILVQLPIPAVMGGVDSPWENVGEMVNTGFEFVLNYTNLKQMRNQFGYNIGLNFTYIDNEVTKFQGGKSPDQLYLIREGYSYNTLYGYKAIGVYQSDEEAKEHMYDNSPTPKAGNLKYEDVNNDGKLGYEDKQGLGNTIPKFTYGLSGAFHYKGFDLSYLFQGVAGVNLYVQNNFTNLNLETRMISTRWRDAWSPDNRDTNIPSLKFNNTWDNYESSFWVRNGSFLKLKNLQLTYTLPEQLLTRIGLQKVSVYANAQNVFTIADKDYEGYDPERNTFGSGNMVYPTPRIISFGVNLNF